MLYLQEKTDNTLKYIVIDTPGIKNHIISRDSEFPYGLLEEGKYYSVRCAYRDGVWVWELAFKIDFDRALK